MMQWAVISPATHEENCGSNNIPVSAERDVPSLMSSCDYLQKEATTLGFYKLREICERIQGASKLNNDFVEGFARGKEYCLSFVGDAIVSLKDNVALSRSALDFFYDAL